MMNNLYKAFTGNDGNTASAIFCSSDKGVYIRQLFGMNCLTDDDSEASGSVQELFMMSINNKCFSALNCNLSCISSGKNSMEISWRISGSDMSLKSIWNFCDESGVLSRRDILINEGLNEAMVSRCLMRFSFEPGFYEVYSQSSSWCGENSGSWQDLHREGFVLTCKEGRTTQGFTPYLCIKKKNESLGAIFHIIPKGNWIIKVREEKSSKNSLFHAVLELGLSDEKLKMCIKPGQQVELPEILILNLPEGGIMQAAPGLHKYFLKHALKPSDRHIPVVYNTWFDVFDFLKTERLEKQLEAARLLGCEVFVIDAGWYGAQEGDWSAQTGDWREKLNGAFRGHMREFADTVRQKGLGFGLWMEPERIGPHTPIAMEHPEWFIQAGNGYLYPDIMKQEVYEYIRNQISGLIAKYDLVWMKLDFNFELGFDPYGSEFLLYYESWYSILEGLRNEYPGVFIEGCASGGMRLEMNSISHCDAHFLSDNVFPQDVLRIYEGAMLRLPPGRVTKWAVLRSIGNMVPRYGTPLEDSPYTIITPKGATWDVSVTNHLDFIVLAAMSGVFGLGGDIAGLPPAIQERLRQHIEIFKNYRKMIYNSIGCILTPMHEGKDDSGWMAHQLQAYDGEGSIIFAYRLDDEQKAKIIKPCALDEKKLYKVAYWDGRKDVEHRSGKSLMDEGITVEIPDKFEAAAIILTPVFIDKS